MEGALFIMDGLGNIFSFDKKLRKMDYGQFPNGLPDYMPSTRDPVSVNVAKAVYIAYDRGTIYASVQNSTPSPDTRVSMCQR